VSQPLLVVEEAFEGIDVERAAAAAQGVRIEASSAATAEEFAAAAQHADGVIVQYLTLGSELFSDSWRVIGRYGIGVDNIDTVAASAHGIAVINVPDYCIDEVAAHAAALTLSSWRRIASFERLVEEGRWSDWSVCKPIERLGEATLGIVGLGRIGLRVAEVLMPSFGRVVAADTQITSAPAGIELTDLATLVRCSDVISLHCPLTRDTRHLFGASRLGEMRPGSLLVNVSRGELVDVDALPAALASGRPGQVALDVLPEEPPTGSAQHLVTDPRVHLTPHVAWYSESALAELRTEIAGRCAAFLQGSHVDSVVNSADLLDGLQ
jgi:D-3-phosphoglycerate dehydrogenase / 2-oxoglutarate reductase